MFFLLQITAGGFLIRQRLVSNRIENTLTAEPNEETNGQTAMKADSVPVV